MVTEVIPKMHRQALNVVRREPTQDRAQKTIETIFEMTAQIVEEEGERALTTNKIAKKAGFSIGTLYQYFPSKEAILDAMAARLRQILLDRLAVVLDQVENASESDFEVFMQAYIHELVDKFLLGSKSWRLITHYAWRYGNQDLFASLIQSESDRLEKVLLRTKNPKWRAPTPTMMFVLSRAILGAIRSASMEKTELINAPEFEEELVRLAKGMLAL
jgi:AcrR family transcriptional regulator